MNLRAKSIRRAFSARHMIPAAALAIISALCFPITAEAQFLEKLSKGLGKINKGLEKIEKITKSDKKKKKKESEQQLPAQSPAKQKQSSSTASAASAASTSSSPFQTVTQKPKTPADWRSKTPTPYLSPRTRFFVKDMMFDNLPVISEGIFYVQEYNRKIGYSAYYGFWTIDGRRLFPAIYEGFTKGQPRFDSGACVVKATGTQRHSPVILYADGKSKSLSHEWENMTQFYDGVAMVCENIERRTLNLFYINTKGEKIWPHLANMNTKSGIALRMRHISEGMRAYYSNPDRAWGFLNNDGSIAIRPRFIDVRDFKNGYALVIEKKQGGGERTFFIDKKGNEVVEVPEAVPTMQYATHISDISNGYFSINGHSEPTRYFNLKGEEVKSFSNGSGFADGNAFVQLEKYTDQIYTINTNFDIAGRWPFKTNNFVGYDINFTRVPYYTLPYDYITINTEGEPVMYVPGGQMGDNRLGQWSRDGYAAARSVFPDPSDRSKKYTYTGYIDTKGEYQVVFVDNPAAGGPFNGELPGPNPPTPIPPYPIPPDTLVSGGPFPIPDPTPRRDRLVPFDTVPIGPQDGGGEHSVRYRVNVIASPAKGGKVYGSGEYAYGDTVRVTGTPAEGYRISYIDCSRKSATTETFNKFVVLGDMDITCYFTKKDTTENIGAAILEGALPQVGFPVYLYLGDGGDNKYAAPSQGYMAIVTDDTKTLSATDSENKGTVKLNLFFVPMDVRGLMEEDGHRYMRIDGGVMKYSNFGFTDNSCQGVFNNPLFSLMIAFDGANQGELQPGMYRVEILDGAAEKGTMTLGMMQRFSPKYGWIDADDPSFQIPLGGFFIKRVDKGLGSDFLNGTVLKKTGERQIKWEPDAAFYGGNTSAMEAFAGALGKLFRRTVAGTPLSDYDMLQFSTDLDNHVFKPKVR